MPMSMHLATLKRYAILAAAVSAASGTGVSRVFGTTAGNIPVPLPADAKARYDAHLQSVCGPRCVRCVLRHFGRDEDLLDLIREMQEGDVDQPSSMEAVSMALEKRGIRTFAMRLAPGAVLQWPHPVVVHLQAEGEPGHFAVWLPTSTPIATEPWMGLGLLRTMTGREFGRRRSGAALLTSDEPITYPGDAVSSLRRVVGGGILYSSSAVAAAVAVSLCVISVRRRRVGAPKRFKACFRGVGQWLDSMRLSCAWR